MERKRSSQRLSERQSRRFSGVRETKQHARMFLTIMPSREIAVEKNSVEIQRPLSEFHGNKRRAWGPFEGWRRVDEIVVHSGCRVTFHCRIKARI